MKNLRRLWFVVLLQNFIIILPLNASIDSGEMLAKKLNLIAGYKAMKQWERVFKSQRKKKRYKIDTLNFNEQKILEAYLIDHAIDSDHPTVAGEL